MLTHTEENYLKVIYHLSQTEDEGISTNAIAQKIDTKASSVTDMIKKLKEKKLITHETISRRFYNPFRFANS